MPRHHIISTEHAIELLVAARRFQLRMCHLARERATAKTSSSPGLAEISIDPALRTDIIVKARNLVSAVVQLGASANIQHADIR